MFHLSHHALFVRSDSIVLFEGKYSLLFELWFTYVVCVYRYNSSAGVSIVLFLCFVFALFCFVLFVVCLMYYMLFSCVFLLVLMPMCVYTLSSFVCLFLCWLVVDCFVVVVVCVGK
jgi:hypothetical protein